jgi:hypothetical protein
MSRPLTGSIRQRQGGWCASLPAHRGTIRRREERFATETEARAWLAHAVAALLAGRPIPDPPRRTQTAGAQVSEQEAPAIRPDIGSVADAWMAAAYEDLRRGGPERAERVRRIVEGYLVPWFAPRTTTIAEVTYVMAHEWLLHLVGRTDPQPRGSDGDGSRSEPRPPGVAPAGEVGLAGAARRCGLSLPTMRRRFHDGQIPGAYRDDQGRIRVPVRALRRVPASGIRAPTGSPSATSPTPCGSCARSWPLPGPTASSRPASTPPKASTHRCPTPPQPALAGPRANRDPSACTSAPRSPPTSTRSTSSPSGSSASWAFGSPKPSASSSQTSSTSAIPACWPSKDKADGASGSATTPAPSSVSQGSPPPQPRRAPGCSSSPPR